MRESGAQIACRWGWGGDFCRVTYSGWQDTTVQRRFNSVLYAMFRRQLFCPLPVCLKKLWGLPQRPEKVFVGVQPGFLSGFNQAVNHSAGLAPAEVLENSQFFLPITKGLCCARRGCWTAPASRPPDSAPDKATVLADSAKALPKADFGGVTFRFSSAHENKASSTGFARPCRCLRFSSKERSCISASMANSFVQKACPSRRRSLPAPSWAGTSLPHQTSAWRGPQHPTTRMSGRSLW